MNAPERYGQIMNAPVSDDIGPRSRRRLHVIAMYGGYAALCLGFWYANAQPSHSAPRYAGLAFVLVAFLVSASGFYPLMRRTLVNSAHIRDSALDERQRALRDRAMRASYLTLSALLAVQALVFVIASSWKNNTMVIMTSGVALAYFWGAFLIAMTLPTAYLAWTTPEPPTSDD